MTRRYRFFWLCLGISVAMLIVLAAMMDLTPFVSISIDFIQKVFRA